MNFAWAIEQLNKGNKVRRSSWENKAYFWYKHVVNNSIYQHGSGCSDDIQNNPSAVEVFADDWENHACTTAKKEDCPTAKQAKSSPFDTMNRIDNELQELKKYTNELRKQINKVTNDFYNHKHVMSNPRLKD